MKLLASHRELNPTGRRTDDTRRQKLEHNGRILRKTEMIDGGTKRNSGWGIVGGGGWRRKQLEETKGWEEVVMLVYRVGRHPGRSRTQLTRMLPIIVIVYRRVINRLLLLMSFPAFPADRHLSSFDLNEAISATTPLVSPPRRRERSARSYR